MRLVDRFREGLAIGQLGRGTASLKKFMATGQARSMEEAVKCLKKAVAGCPTNSKTRSACLTALGAALREQYNRSGNVENQEGAIEAWEEALRLTHPDSPDRPGALSNVAIGLFDRYARLGQLADLDKAIACYDEALNALPAASGVRIDILNNLGTALRVRYGYDGDVAYLDRAKQAHEEAVRLSPPKSSNLHLYLNSLGDDLRASYNRGGDLGELDRAVQSYGSASQLCSQAAPIRPMYLSNWGTALRLRYLATGGEADLAQSITALTQAVEESPASAPNLPTYLSNLGAGMIARFSRYGRVADLDRAVEVNEEAVRLSPPGAPEAAGRRSALALALNQRYTNRGDSADLERSIQLHQEALKVMPRGGPDSLFSLNNLGAAFRSRYESSGDLADLQRAIDTYESAKEQLLPGASVSSACLANLGAALRIRYERLDDPNDLNSALQAYNDALKYLPDGSPELPSYLNDLANGWNARYRYTGNVDDLNAVVTVSASAVHQCAHEDAVYPVCCSTLGSALRDRYDKANDVGDLDAAVTIQQAALDQSQPGSPLQAALLNGLANSLSVRYEHSGSKEDLQQATTYYAQACEEGSRTDVAAAMMASSNWGNWALKRQAWEECARAYGFGLDALDRLFRTQLLRASKESWLREAGNLCASAAYALAHVGEVRRAVEVLEHGHARLLSEVLERDRAELETLRAVAPETYSQYAAASSRLQALESADVSGHTAPPSLSSFEAANAAAAARPAFLPRAELSDLILQGRTDVDQAVTAIRQVPGYQNFLLPSGFGQIQQVAKLGPLIYFAVTQVGGLALMVLPPAAEQANDAEGDSSIKTIWLPELTEPALKSHLMSAADMKPTGYLDSYLRWKTESDAGGDWRTSLDETTHWLWSVAMAPVLQMLSQQSASRAVIISQGLLGLLPLHAAWTEDPTSPTGRSYALDTVAFSYAPNARALAACETIAAKTPADVFLAVGDPQPITLAEALPNAILEISAASVTFTSANLLKGEDATRKAFLEQLQAKMGSPSAVETANVLHFSCHGQARLAQPLESGLLMGGDEWLTVRDLFALRLSGVRLAILSACETGISGIRLPDELIGLPTGMIQAGVAGVVASLWPVSEISTVLLLVRFYSLWRGESISIDQALQKAQIWLRDTRNEEKADYFKQSLPDFGDLPRSPAYPLPVEVADSLFEDMMLRPLGERDFSHPYHWAAFGLTGV